jgi:hypothetical protein
VLENGREESLGDTCLWWMAFQIQWIVGRWKLTSNKMGLSTFWLLMITLVIRFAMGALDFGNSFTFKQSLFLLGMKKKAERISQLLVEQLDICKLVP